MSTLIIEGSVLDLPDGSIARSIRARIPCAPAPAQRIIELTSDSPFGVALDGITKVNALCVESDHPVSMRIDSAAGSSQTIPLESLYLVSRSVAITAITFVRVAGQVTTVRLIFGQGA